MFIFRVDINEGVAYSSLPQTKEAVKTSWEARTKDEKNFDSLIKLS